MPACGGGLLEATPSGADFRRRAEGLSPKSQARGVARITARV